MTKIEFLICGRRAFDTVKHFVKTVGAQSISVLVTYADKSVLNDPYTELIEFSNANGIELKHKNDYIYSGNNYRIVIGWQRMIDTDNRTIVLHDSLLPRYRGFAPLVNSLCKGETSLGVTAFFASGEYDMGPIIVQRELSIKYPITILNAMEHITPLYFQIIDYVVEGIKSGDLRSTEQDETKASYGLWRDEEDYRINWSLDAKEIERMINAVGFPYTGATALLNGALVKILSVQEEADLYIENRVPGKIIFISNGHPVVACGHGVLKIVELIAGNGQNLLPIKKLRSRFQ